MLLTLSQPTKVEFGGNRFTHDFSPRISLARSRIPSHVRVDSPVGSLRASPPPSLAPPSYSADHDMTTPHRGLPPPSAMGLPEPARPPPSQSHHIGAMPAPPGQWHGQEESMRNWLVAKAEEDRRKQEEEKTKQEGFRLEQRRIEQSMLRESLQAGVPPTMVPIIYAGLAGSHMANLSIEWLQQYAAQLQAAAQPSQVPVSVSSSSPAAARDVRSVGPSALQHPGMVPSAQHPSLLTSHPHEQQPPAGPLATTFSVYQPASARAPPTSAPRPATHSTLPRLTTNEVYVHPSAPSGPLPLQQAQSLQSEQQASSSSNSIYFHHWVPPTTSQDSSKPSNPQTPANKHDTPSGSLLSESGEYRDSPRKRKAIGPHQPAPQPSSSSSRGGIGPQYTSPSYSATSSGSVGPARRMGHVRGRSNSFPKDATESRPASSSRREGEGEMALSEDPKRASGAAESREVRRDRRIGWPEEDEEEKERKERARPASREGGGEGGSNEEARSSR